MVDIKAMTTDELKMLSEDIRLEMAKRADLRFKELATEAVSALKALHAEFPYARYEIEVNIEDAEYGVIDIDIMDYVDRMTVSKFYN